MNEVKRKEMIRVCEEVIAKQKDEKMKDMSWTNRYKREKNKKKEIKVKNANCNISKLDFKGMKS